MAGYLGEYALALGVRLKTNDIEDLAWPAIKQWDGKYACVGVRICQTDIVRGVRSWETYCSVDWEAGDANFWCGIGEWFSTQKMAADVCQKFQRINAKVDLYEENNVMLYEYLRPEEAVSFERTLEAMSRQWIKLWKKVGGMKNVFKE